MQLWLIGVMVGMFWWIVYWQMYTKRAWPSFRGALGFIFTFVFWFLSPTRLGGYPAVQDALFEEKPLLHQSVLRGCASLRPGAYYFHRITTLSIFWVWAYCEHGGFFHIVFKSIALGKGEVIVSVLLVSGWLA